MMMKTTKKVLCLALSVAMMCCVLTACGNEPTDNSADTETTTTAGTTATTTTTTDQTVEVSISQLALPQAGEEVAVMHTTMGDIYIRLFPEAAPKAVENFTTHAKDGYYDGLTFHRVISDFMIQGGDPEGTGRGGESIWGEAFEDEFHTDLHNLRGALSMANAGSNTNGSQFFIVQAKTVAAELVDQMNQLPDSYPAECVKNYQELGGTPWLDYQHTVFGQVFQGMDVVDAIAAVETDESDKPVEDVIVQSIEIVKWEA